MKAVHQAGIEKALPVGSLKQARQQWLTDAVKQICEIDRTP